MAPINIVLVIVVVTITACVVFTLICAQPWPAHPLREHATPPYRFVVTYETPASVKQSVTLSADSYDDAVLRASITPERRGRRLFDVEVRKL